VIESFSRQRPIAKLGVIAVGYGVAVVIAMLVVRVYMAATSSVDRQGSGGMSAFGDSLVFLAALGVAAIPATVAALFVLRSRPAFWRVLSVGSLLVACTALLALVLSFGSAWIAGTRLQVWGMAAPLRILAAPLLALFFLLSGLFAPIRSARLRLVGAAAIEFVAFISVAFWWWRSSR
jgi:hypothetical protein